MGKTFVGFGFGPIQSALFLYEAAKSGNFSRFVIAEVDANMVRAIRDGEGSYWINIAHQDRIEQARIDGVELYNPGVPADRAKLVEALRDCDEIATCLPSVKFFDSGDASVAKLLAEGLGSRKAPHPTIIYTAENNNHAAEILQADVSKYAPNLPGVQFLNTVIGKMSGVITDEPTIKKFVLKTLTADTPKAVLVEAFNKILITRITLSGYRRGIDVFIEKEDLLPFEEAKLYGHNAIHALIGYLCEFSGLPTMADAVQRPWIIETARKAFIDESGAAMIRKHGKLNDPLFTPAGYRAYAEDLLERMVCANLNDLVVRICRDQVRKLGYDDRLFGTMRLALAAGVQPTNMAKGAAAAVLSLLKLGGPEATLDGTAVTAATLTEEKLGKLLTHLWSQKADADAPKLVQLTWQALGQLPRP